MLYFYLLDLSGYVRKKTSRLCFYILLSHSLFHLPFSFSILSFLCPSLPSHSQLSVFFMLDSVLQKSFRKRGGEHLGD